MIEDDFLISGTEVRGSSLCREKDLRRLHPESRGDHGTGPLRRLQGYQVQDSKMAGA